jgi:pyruvate/2-oxoglutarate dehydrogenase complex dihydrolipoamide acyltransferase (E2) component
MSNYTVVLPSLGDDDDALKGGKVAFWLLEIGQPVHAGGDLLEIETDKAVFVVPSPVAGTLKQKLVREDDNVRVGDPLAEIAIE